MTKKIDLIVANPAGNTTLLVLTPTDRKDYQEITDKLLAIDYCKDFGVSFSNSNTVQPGGMTASLFGEQVAFVLPSAMEMSGLEFCGNASRAFAYYTVREALRKGSIDFAGHPVKTTISVSGCNHPIDTYVDIANNQVEIEMPAPIDMQELSGTELGLDDACCGGTLIDLDGITHLVLEDVTPSREIFERLKSAIYKRSEKDIPALGIMFINSKTLEMTPVVHVKDVDTTYWEGSCASGTTAASCALAAKAADGIHEYTITQPAGTLHTKVATEQGRIKSVNLSGLMELSPVITIEI